MEDSKGQLCLAERRVIWKGRRLGYSVSKIAKEVGRSKSTISRELRRNANSGADWIDLSNQAQDKAKHRRIQANKSRTRLKAFWIQKHVEEKLKADWTPELISIRLKEVDKSDVTISHEAIYQWILRDRTDLIQYLPVVGRYRRRRRGKKSYQHKEPAAPKTSIDERPKEIESRNEVGHWESDLIESSGSNAALVHMRERKTRYSKIAKVDDKKALSNKRAIMGALVAFKGIAAKTLTLDNGVENAFHADIAEELNVSVYFTHPYSSWEKGTIENGNRAVRVHYPKGTDFAALSSEDITELEYRLNNRPMKCLKGRTPNEAMSGELKVLGH